MYIFQNLNAKIKHGVNDKVRPDLDLRKGSNLGMGGGGGGGCMRLKGFTLR